MNSKIYRCGWCGNPCNEKSEPLQDGNFRRVINIIENYKADEHTHLVNGDCCIEELTRQEKVQITRDMAIDAGDRNLEGQWIKW